MTTTDELIPLLKKLRLSGLLQSLELRTKEACEEDSSFGEFLYRLLLDEVERREAKQLELRLRRANFEQNKNLMDFDFGFNPQIPKSKIIELGNCSFVARRENIALIGPSGVGKSHIAQSLGQRACMAGYSTLLLSAHDMFVMLRAAKGDGSYEKKLQKMASVNLLIIDDLGLRVLTGEEPVDLYEVLRQRYERGSVIVTSNRAIEEWYGLFGDALLASAALDRYLHHSHVIVMEGDSFRNPPPKKSSKKNENEKMAPVEHSQNLRG